MPASLAIYSCTNTMETLGIIEVCFGALRLGAVSSSLFLFGITAFRND
jgi:hypothetical protein